MRYLVYDDNGDLIAGFMSLVMAEGFLEDFWGVSDKRMYLVAGSDCGWPSGRCIDIWVNGNWKYRKER